jgi:hypothetical protein
VSTDQAVSRHRWSEFTPRTLYVEFVSQIVALTYISFRALLPSSLNITPTTAPYSFNYYQNNGQRPLSDCTSVALAQHTRLEIKIYEVLLLCSLRVLSVAKTVYRRMFMNEYEVLVE